MENENLEENNKLEEIDSEIDECEEMSNKKKVTELTFEQDRIISDLFKKGNHLPFYKSSGTSVFTCRKPPDYNDFHFKLPEFKYYVPKNFFQSSFKKPRSRKKKGKM